VLDGADVARWIDIPPPELRFAIADLIPDGCVSLMAGDGGGGKSILMQTAATCIALGQTFLGRTAAAGPALYLTAEDTDAIVHARQARINRALGIGMADLAGKLFAHSAADRDFTLFAGGEETVLLRALTTEIAAYGIRFVVIDNAALTFDDLEIDRRAVSTFLRSLNTLARRTGAAVVLIAHTSKSSDSTSARMASGSTAWVNAARAGLLLKTVDDGAELTLAKANYSKRGTKIELRWTDDGVLVAVDQPSGMVADIDASNDDKMVLAQIAARWDDPTVEPLTRTKHGGERYLPGFMTRKHGWAVKRTERAMLRLADAGKIATARKRDKDIDAMGLRPCRG
jgi:RecA-family ATPase